MIKEVLFIITSLLVLASCRNTSNSSEIFSYDSTSIDLNQCMDSIEIGGKFLTTEDLDSKTIDFLRYARNEIYAKRGYIFKDSCLNLFFSHQKWYAGTEEKMQLTEKEKEWIKMIKLIEEKKTGLSPFKLISKYNFNGRPLFYIASELFDRGDTNIEYSLAQFYLLDSSDLWMLDCKSLPLEYIISKTIDSVFCKDASYVVNPHEISIINFDSTCNGGEYKEIKVRLYGPSSDDEHWIIGYDQSGRLSNLISGVWIMSEYKSSDSTIQFTSRDRCDRIGTEFCDIDYLFNSKTRKLKRITKEKYQHRIPNKTQTDSVKVYTSERAALKEYEDSILLTIPPNTDVFISHFLGKNHVYLIEYKNRSGWITQEELHKFYVSFAD